MMITKETNKPQQIPTINLCFNCLLNNNQSCLSSTCLLLKKLNFLPLYPPLFYVKKQFFHGREGEVTDPQINYMSLAHYPPPAEMCSFTFSKETWVHLPVRTAASCSIRQHGRSSGAHPEVRGCACLECPVPLQFTTKRLKHTLVSSVEGA